MRLTVWLALRDLLRNRLPLICNAAVLASVLVPMLVLFGVKNGVFATLTARLLSAPGLLQIDTTGEASLSLADLDEVSGWPDVAFATLKARSMFDFVSVRGTVSRVRADAVVFPTSAGDPILPPGLAPTSDEAVLSEALAAEVKVTVGDEVAVITQSETRSPQLMQTRRVVAIVPADDGEGRLVLLDLASVDRIEAFYDGYALPDQGVPDGRSLATRKTVYEGLRVFAHRIEDLAAIDARLAARFSLRTQSHANEAERLRAFGASLDLALGLAAGIAALGLATALLFSFWGEVQRKRRVLATLALMGLPPTQIALFPLLQAMMTALCGLATAFGLTFLAAMLAEWLFAGSMATAQGLVVLTPGHIALVTVAVLTTVVLTAGAAAAAALRIDPASILRDEV